MVEFVTEDYHEIQELLNRYIPLHTVTYRYTQFVTEDYHEIQELLNR